MAIVTPRLGAEAQAFLNKNPDVVSVHVIWTDMCGVIRGKILRRDEVVPAWNDGRFMPISALVQVVADDTRNPHPEFCCNRNASGYAVLGGVRFDNSGLIAGQFALGYRHRSFAAGGSSQGVTYDARIQWYPTALVTVGLTADQQYRNSGITAANAVLVNKQSLTVAYEMYRDLNFNLQVGREASHYREVDVNTLLKSISLRATYTSRRLLQLTAFAQYAVSDTSRPALASGYDTKRVGLTVRVRI